MSSPIKNQLTNLCGLKWPGGVIISIWIIGLIILIGCTIRDFLPLFDEYQNKNTATQINIISDSSLLKMPPVSLSIRYDDVKLRKIAQNLPKFLKNESAEYTECRKMAEKSWDVWQNMTLDIFNENLTNLQPSLAEEIIKKLISMSVEEIDHILSSSNFDWNQPIIDAIIYYFSRIKLQDIFIFQGETKTNFELSKEKHFLALLLSDQIKIDKLRLAVFSIFCEHIQFRSQPKKYCLDFLSNNPTVFSGGSALELCFTLPNMANLTDLKLLITANDTKRGVRAAFNTSQSIYIYSDHDSLYWYPGMLNNFPIYVSEDFGDKALLAYRQMLIVLEKREGAVCYNESSILLCQYNCMVRKTIELCKCIPFTFQQHVNITDILPYCNNILYSNCDLNAIKDMENCKQQCKDPCEYLLYQWQVTRKNLNRPQDNYNGEYRALGLTVHSITATFVEFDNTIKNTWEQFLAQIGSVANLYLGFSGLSIIALAIFCWEILQRWYSMWQRENTNGSNTSQQENNDNVLINKSELADIKLRLLALESGHSNLMMTFNKEFDFERKYGSGVNRF